MLLVSLSDIVKDCWCDPPLPSGNTFLFIERNLRRLQIGLAILEPRRPMWWTMLWGFTSWWLSVCREGMIQDKLCRWCCMFERKLWWVLRIWIWKFVVTFCVLNSRNLYMVRKSPRQSTEIRHEMPSERYPQLTAFVLMRIFQRVGDAKLENN